MKSYTRFLLCAGGLAFLTLSSAAIAKPPTHKTPGVAEAKTASSWADPEAGWVPIDLHAITSVEVREIAPVARRSGTERVAQGRHEQVAKVAR